MHAALTPQPISFFCTEPHNLSKCREQMTLGVQHQLKHLKHSGCLGSLAVRIFPSPLSQCSLNVSCRNIIMQVLLSQSYYFMVVTSLSCLEENTEYQSTGQNK